jgi:hypothetical protein
VVEEQPTVIVAETVVPDAELEDVVYEEDIYDVEEEEDVVAPTAQQKQPKKNMLQNMTEYFKNWFEDDAVNGDFDK